MSARATTRGRRSGPSMVANVSPGTPATANRPRHPLRVAEGQLEHGVDAHRPAHQHGPVDAEVVHDRERVLDERARCRRGSGRPAGPSRRCRGGSTTRRGRRSPGRSSAGQAQALVPRPLQSTTVGPSIMPSGSLVQAAQPGAVVGEHVVEGQVEVVGRGARRGGRHAHDSARAVTRTVPVSASRARRRRAPASGSEAPRGEELLDLLALRRRCARRVQAIMALRRAVCWDATGQVREAVEDGGER